MKALLRWSLLFAIALSAQVAFATPQADANYIAQRSLSPTTLNDLKRTLKEPFVEVYFRPFVGLGIEIADMDRFLDLIPDEEIGPVLDRFISGSASRYLSSYTRKQLAVLAALLRADPDTSTLEIFSGLYHQKFERELDQAREEAKHFELTDPDAVELEEMRVLLEAHAALLEQANGFFFPPETAVSSIAALLAFGGYRADVAQLHRDPNNPVARAALETHGILRFANPVQRQTLHRQYSASEDVGGARFVKPPSRNTN